MGIYHDIASGCKLASFFQVLRYFNPNHKPHTKLRCFDWQPTRHSHHSLVIRWFDMILRNELYRNARWTTKKFCWLSHQPGFPIAVYPIAAHQLSFGEAGYQAYQACHYLNIGIQPKSGWKELTVVVADGLYPLVNVYITMENHHFQWVNPL